MKKPQVIKKISHGSPRPSEPTIGTIGQMLNKLEPQQLTDLFNSATKIFESNTQYAIECEKTKQTEINARVEIEKSNERFGEAKLNHEKFMAEIKKQQKDNESQHEKDLIKLEKKYETINHILDLVAEGKISEDALIAALNQ